LRRFPAAGPAIFRRCRRGWSFSDEAAGGAAQQSSGWSLQAPAAPEQADDFDCIF